MQTAKQWYHTYRSPAKIMCLRTPIWSQFKLFIGLSLRFQYDTQTPRKEYGIIYGYKSLILHSSVLLVRWLLAKANLGLEKKDWLIDVKTFLFIDYRVCWFGTRINEIRVRFRVFLGTHHHGERVLEVRVLGKKISDHFLSACALYGGQAILCILLQESFARTYLQRTITYSYIRISRKFGRNEKVFFSMS